MSSQADQTRSVRTVGTRAGRRGRCIRRREVEAIVLAAILARATRDPERIEMLRAHLAVLDTCELQDLAALVEVGAGTAARVGEARKLALKAIGRDRAQVEQALVRRRRLGELLVVGLLRVGRLRPRAGVTVKRSST